MMLSMHAGMPSLSNSTLHNIKDILSNCDSCAHLICRQLSPVLDDGGGVSLWPSKGNVLVLGSPKFFVRVCIKLDII